MAELFFGWCNKCHQKVECLEHPIDPDDAQCLADHFISVEHKNTSGERCDASGKSPDGMIQGEDAELWPDDDVGPEPSAYERHYRERYR